MSSTFSMNIKISRDSSMAITQDDRILLVLGGYNCGESDIITLCDVYGDVEEIADVYIPFFMNAADLYLDLGNHIEDAKEAIADQVSDEEWADRKDELVNQLRLWRAVMEIGR